MRFEAAIGVQGLVLACISTEQGARSGPQLLPQWEALLQLAGFCSCETGLAIRFQDLLAIGKRVSVLCRQALRLKILGQKSLDLTRT